jgi:ERCC4-type nuclease
MQHYSPPAPTVFLRKPKIVQRVAKEFTGVGWDKAGALSRVFPSVVDLVLADEKQLQRAVGIGRGLAASIRKEVMGDDA